MSEKDRNPQQPDIQVQIPADVQRGSYANNMVVSHSQEEFVIDYIMVTPPVGIVNARVIVSPSHAKRMARALLDNVSKYEAAFGKIPDAEPVGAPLDPTSIN